MNQVLPYVPALLCPISMGAMMWCMMRGSSRTGAPDREVVDRRVVQLEREVGALRDALQRDAAESRQAS